MFKTYYKFGKYIVTRHLFMGRLLNKAFQVKGILDDDNYTRTFRKHLAL